ncbi:MAG: hypothetical protein Kow0031_27340 [Anaerolineae bacterium]
MVCLLGWLMHLAGVALVARLTHQPAWAALLLLALPPLVTAWRRNHSLCPRWRTLSPLLLLYGAAVLRLVIAALVRVLQPGAEAAIPPPWGDLLELNRLAMLAAVLTLLLQTPARWRGHFLLAAGLLWAAVTYFALATHGVTAVDPYGYVQMAVDLAERGTAVHRFPLAPLAASWGLSLYPTVPLGFTFPSPVTGLAGTAWPPGHSVLLAVGYLLAGEPGLYRTTPLLGLVALPVMWALARELLRPGDGAESPLSEAAQGWVAGLSALILATSYQQLEWLTVAMSDVSAQICGMLLLYFALRSRRRRSTLDAALSGVCLGLAFSMRYTQVLLAVPALYLLIQGAGARSRESGGGGVVARLAAFGISAALMAMPMLTYYTDTFGSPFSTGSKEIGHFALANVGSTIPRIVTGLLVSNEFLWLLPLLLTGVAAQSRINRPRLAGLLLAVLTLVLFHLPYNLLATRHLLPLFPIFAFWSALGAVWLVVAGEQGSKGAEGKPVTRDSQLAIRIFVATTLVLTLLLARSFDTLRLAVNPHFGTYGYLTAAQRAAFDALAAATPPDAVIAASTNGGAVTLYAQRDIVRPGDWSEAEWLAFADNLRQTGRPLYLLVDGVKMEAPRAAIEAVYPLGEPLEFPFTYFRLDGTGEARPVWLYQVTSDE